MKKILSISGSRSGQTIVEAIVAIGILTTGLLGILALLTRSFAINSTANADTQATYLAAEGIELAKNLIDHDVYLFLAGSGGGWGTTCFGGVGVGASKDFELDYATTGCPTAWSDPGRFIGIDPAKHLYSYGPGTTPTGFTRRIRVSRPSAQEIEVQSIVTWNVGGPDQQSVILDDHFYSWRMP